LRGGGVDLRQTIAQAPGVGLRNGKWAEAALETTRAAGDPSATASNGLSHQGIDLDELIRGW
jgi:hypothetical protein